MSHNLNSGKGLYHSGNGLYKRMYRGLLKGLLRGMLGV